MSEKLSDSTALQNKFRTLAFALTTNPNLRSLLLEEDIEVTQFIEMKEKDLANDELKKKRKEINEYNMAAKRTDALLEQELKMTGDSMY